VLPVKEKHYFFLLRIYLVFILLLFYMVLPFCEFDFVRYSDGVDASQCGSLTRLGLRTVTIASMSEEQDPCTDLQQEPRLWRVPPWTARVIKNEDDDGWAVAMLLDGQSEPALVGPWTMGRDKKNPKPLDTAAFNTLVKTAKEVIRRSEQQRHAELNKCVQIAHGEGRLDVLLTIVPDDEGATATLRAVADDGEELACVRVSPGFQLNARTAQGWAESGFSRPQAGE
jgi:hypothetical protein